MVAAVRTTLNPKTETPGRGGGGGGGGGRPQNPTRPPLLPSEPANGFAPPRRHKAREVTSRSRRCPSPMVSRTATSKAAMAPATPSVPASKRSQSVERKRAATSRPNSLDLRNLSGAGGGGEMSAAQKLLFTSTRSLSVSFQGESFSLQVSKVKPAPPSPSVRKGTPERRKAGTTPARGDQSENLKPIEPQRWPGRLRQSDCANRSLDSNDEERSRSTGGSGGNVVSRALQNSMVDGNGAAPVNGRLSSASGNAELQKTTEPVMEANSAIGSDALSDHVASSDTESVSSGCTTPGALEFGRQGQRGPRGIGVTLAARFWQESKNRSQRLPPEPGSPLSRTTGLKAFSAPTKLVPPKKLSIDSPVSSPRGVLSSRGQSSPIRGAFRPASPSKASIAAVSSPLRGMSPSRIRNLVPGTPSGNNGPSILSFAADIRRGKAGENRILDAHVLRLLYNRLLQWRFINARADASLSAQRLNAERSLYNAWVTTAELRESVRAKRSELQLMRQTLKLISILKGQMVYLEKWSLVDRDYTGSLSGAFEALRASTLRLPVVGGARAEVQNVKDAICSAVDVMQAMASSICLLTSKVGEVNSLVGEISNLTAKERALLGQCKSLLSTVAALQVKECSLRTHILQIKRVQT
ncbi:QWRF family [Parasponia andersonii]|uniref:QWRF family n=1 Tax=Parasponia andersonii TaxID=3476 RepID=A0A2P5BZU7_PARAD|nr:QWRF family [Parasponia andersonii]